MHSDSMEYRTVISSNFKQTSYHVPIMTAPQQQATPSAKTMHHSPRTSLSTLDSPACLSSRVFVPHSAIFPPSNYKITYSRYKTSYFP